MTATAHLEHEPPAPSPPAGPGTPVFEVGDLVEDPRTDVEALCLCALLWAPAPAAATVTELLQVQLVEHSEGDLDVAVVQHVRRVGRGAYGLDERGGGSIPHQHRAQRRAQRTARRGHRHGGGDLRRARGAATRY
jgi:hypothetical protein